MSADGKSERAVGERFIVGGGGRSGCRDDEEGNED